MPPTLYLIDGHALAYRTFYALTSGAAGGRWQTSSGEPTAGVYGFATVLMRLLEDQVLVATEAQETRDLIRILVDLFKSRGDVSPVITAADFT